MENSRLHAESLALKISLHFVPFVRQRPTRGWKSQPCQQFQQMCFHFPFCALTLFFVKVKNHLKKIQKLFCKTKVPFILEICLFYQPFLTTYFKMLIKFDENGKLWCRGKAQRLYGRVLYFVSSLIVNTKQCRQFIFQLEKIASPLPPFVVLISIDFCLQANVEMG